MLFPGIKRIAKELQLLRTDGVAVGLVGNCHISLYDGSNVKVLDIKFPGVNDEFKSKIERELEKKRLKKFEWLENLLRVSFFELVWPYSVDKIKKTTQDLVRISSESFPNQQILCNSCKSSSAVDSYYASNSIYILCQQCAKAIAEEYNQAETDHRIKPNRYLVATVFGLLCSIPAILISAVLFIFLNRIAALSAMIFVFFILWGYRKAEGKTDPTGATIIVIFSLLMTGIGIAASYMLNILYLTKSIAETFRMLSLQKVQSEMFLNIFLSVLVSSVYLALQVFELRKMWRFPKLQKAFKIE